ncbi:Probable inactive ATP-dependent zinc metalloprotease FTSHI 2, chloroplastic [Linum grandiflorum]
MRILHPSMAATHFPFSTSTTSPRHKFPSKTSISCRIQNPDPETDDEHRRKLPKPKPNHTRFNFLTVPVTLTVISTALSQTPSALAAAAATTSKPVQKRKTQKKPAEPLSPEQLKQWTKDLPLVSTRMPYTEILSLKEQGKLKHVIKPPNAKIRDQAEGVLVVLDDNQVFRTVLPSVESNMRFWDKWDELKIDALFVNAYTPPVKIGSLPLPYLDLLLRLVPPEFFQIAKEKKVGKKAMEMRRMKEEFKRQQKEEVKRMGKEREMMEKAVKLQKKEERRMKKKEDQKRKFEASLRDARLKNARMSMFWADLANDSNFTTLLGMVFFVIFYRTVVLNYKKQKKDYDDRMKIEKAEADERKKMKEMDRDAMMEIEQGGDREQNAYMKMATQFMKSGARVKRVESKRPPQYLEKDVDVKFTDVAGLGKIRLELEEIVKFFTHGDMYRRRGVKIPGGILLCGPPGIGKTLLAKAVAGEAGVNFFSISASQFVEIYVGVGASRVRSLYQEARENSPSVVFIDELDAVGRERGLIKGSGGQERDATLNQLLVCLDGFEGRGEVITIASTNRPDILDPALVRPGRFDRKIHIPKPGVIGRMEILKVHARKKPVAEDVDYRAVATVTDGMVGAELANILEVAAINMMRDGRTEITTDDLLQAAQIEERGLLDRKERSAEAWRQVAINEASMAVVALNFADLRTIEFVTISPRAGRELGYVRVKLDHLKFNAGMLSRQSLLDHITVQVAPRAADELWYGKGQLSTIWAETADNARSAARTYVLGGLSENHHGISDFWVTDRINAIDVEALQILNMCYDRAREILKDNRALMDAIVDRLVDQKSLSKKEFYELVDLHGVIRPLPPSLLDIRAAKREEFQRMMTTMSQNKTEVIDSSV